MTRSLDPRCPIARALEIVGEKWTFLLLREMILHGPRRFQDFLAGVPGLSPATLSARLKTLEEGGVIERRFDDQHPPRAEYLLTEKGLALRPVVRALREWGEVHAPRRAPPG